MSLLSQVPLHPPPPPSGSRHLSMPPVSTPSTSRRCCPICLRVLQTSFVLVKLVSRCSALGSLTAMSLTTLLFVVAWSSIVFGSPCTVPKLKLWQWRRLSTKKKLLLHPNGPPLTAPNHPRLQRRPRRLAGKGLVSRRIYRSSRADLLGAPRQRNHPGSGIHCALRARPAPYSAACRPERQRDTPSLPGPITLHLRFDHRATLLSASCPNSFTDSSTHPSPPAAHPPTPRRLLSVPLPRSPGQRLS